MPNIPLNKIVSQRIICVILFVNQNVFSKDQSTMYIYPLAYQKYNSRLLFGASNKQNLFCKAWLKVVSSLHHKQTDSSSVIQIYVLETTKRAVRQIC